MVGNTKCKVSKRQYTRCYLHFSGLKVSQLSVFSSPWKLGPTGSVGAEGLLTPGLHVFTSDR